MNYLRVVLILILLGVGTQAVLLEPHWMTYAVVGGGALALLIGLLLEVRIRQGDPQTVVVAGVGLVLGWLVASILLGLATRVPAIGGFLALGSWTSSFAVIFVFAFFGYMGAVAGRAVAVDLTLFRQPDREAGVRARFLVGEKSLIDGRIVRLAESSLLSGEIIVPRFVVDQLNELTAGHAPIDRFRGERGLDSLRRLQQNRMRAVFIREIDLLHGEIEGVLDYAVKHDARVVTHNSEMIKEAGRRGIPIVNLNEIAAMLEPEVLSGDELVVRLVKPGKESDQAVGYLDNGNMVVVEEGRADIGKTIRVSVTGIHQTRAGTLIFAKRRLGSGEFDVLESAPPSDEPDAGTVFLAEEEESVEDTLPKESAG